METTLEVLPFGGRGRRNRKWPDEVKARIVAATLTPGITVHAVARHHGVPANPVFAWRTRAFAWRTRARKGRLVLPAPEGPVEFASLMIGPVGDGPRCAVGAVERPEIIAGAVAIRLETGASAERIASVVRALAASP
ncbi:transposase [Pseudogemmobacter bohemicus]|uniref:transposase n=1 Tax=Pseudogemmobacter bohemicus TaxID=2250708 RepID=UPI0022B81F83|nr:transposase [Pseudogemmobacter bohemicus]